MDLLHGVDLNKLNQFEKEGKIQEGVEYFNEMKKKRNRFIKKLEEKRERKKTMMRKIIPSPLHFYFKTLRQ